MIENCPECGSAGRMLLVGLPGPELAAALDARRIGLSGCMVEPGANNWACPAGHGWRDEDFGGRRRLLDEILAECNAPPPPPTAQVGGGIVEWRIDAGALAFVKPGLPAAIAPFTPHFPVHEFEYDYEFVLSPDERHVVLFIDSKRRRHGYELFRLEPAFEHVGGMQAPGHECPPVFSPDGRWLVTFAADGYRVRGTNEHFTDLFDKYSDRRVTLDWASLHVLHLPDGARHRIDVGVQMPVSAYPHEYTRWKTVGGVRFAGDDVVLRMPWGAEVTVPLPPSAAVTADRTE